ncbi:MAG: hypothetical protein HY033_12360 [Ignavibacteriae bacterium]|nr:hypothetical protein [Ignavibacteria bacterium]MBI3365685.1 hypothetical protein [Ignavibacteriota bacterium]
MLRFWCYIWILCIISSKELRAQDRPYAVAFFGSINTSSKLFYNPNDQDEFIRNQFLPLDNAFSEGVDVRRTIEPLRISVGFSIEYLSKTQSFIHPLSQSTLVPVKDGFVVYPIEFSAYFPIPIGGDLFQLYMGGGAGAYLGARRYEYAGIQASAVDRKTGYGIHIVSGLQYFLRPSFSLRSELKFRNVQFETINQFSQSTAVSSSGTIIPLDQEPFASRVNIDGMTVSLQLVYHF